MKNFSPRKLLQTVLRVLTFPRRYDIVSVTARSAFGISTAHYLVRFFVYGGFRVSELPSQVIVPEFPQTTKTISRGRVSSGKICPKCNGIKHLYSLSCRKCMKRSINGRWIGEQKVTYFKWRKIVTAELKRRDGNSCGYCGIAWPQLEYHVDHIIPASRGGGDELDNLVLACEFCNMAKHDHDVLVFLRWFSHLRSSGFECKARPIVNSYLEHAEAAIHDRLQKSWFE